MQFEGAVIFAVIGLLWGAMRLRPWLAAKFAAVARLTRRRDARQKVLGQTRQQAVRRRLQALAVSPEESVAAEPVPPADVPKKAPAILLHYRRALKKSASSAPHSASSTPPRHSRRWFSLGRATKS
jgi:hypothetical protein